MKNKILKIAHRGFSQKYPENTIPAFIKAIESGADMIEFDIHMTRDGRLAVIHDDRIDRTSNGTGMVGDMTLKELREYDFSYNSGLKNVAIPTLEDVLELSRNKIGLNIEIKNCPANYSGIEDVLAALLKKMDFIDPVIVSSFDHFSLKRLKGIDGRIKTGMLYDSLWVKFQEEARELEVYSVHPGIDSAFSSQLLWAKEHGIKVYPWVALDRVTIDRLIGTGWVDGIMVNDPGLF